MPALTTDRDTQRMSGHRRALPLEANAKVFGGGIACVNAAGRLTRGITATGLRCVGVALQLYDNTGGAAAAITGEAERGVFGPFANSASTDQITNADIGADCFIVDDQTVAKTNGTNTRSVAGKVYLVDAQGVWVDFP